MPLSSLPLLPSFFSCTAVKEVGNIKLHLAGGHRCNGLAILSVLATQKGAQVPGAAWGETPLEGEVRVNRRDAMLHWWGEMQPHTLGPFVSYEGARGPQGSQATLPIGNIPTGTCPLGTTLEPEGCQGRRGRGRLVLVTPIAHSG